MEYRHILFVKFNDKEKLEFVGFINLKIVNINVVLLTSSQHHEPTHEEFKY